MADDPNTPLTNEARKRVLADLASTPEALLTKMQKNAVLSASKRSLADFATFLALLGNQAEKTADKSLAIAHESAATADKNLKIAEAGLTVSERNLQMQSEVKSLTDDIKKLTIQLKYFTIALLFLAVIQTLYPVIKSSFEARQLNPALNQDTNDKKPDEQHN